MTDVFSFRLFCIAFTYFVELYAVWIDGQKSFAEPRCKTDIGRLDDIFQETFTWLCKFCFLLFCLKDTCHLITGRINILQIRPTTHTEMNTSPRSQSKNWINKLQELKDTLNSHNVVARGKSNGKDKNNT